MAECRSLFPNLTLCQDILKLVKVDTCHSSSKTPNWCDNLVVVPIQCSPALNFHQVAVSRDQKLERKYARCNREQIYPRLRAMDNMKDNTIHPNPMYPTNLVGPKSSGSCNKPRKRTFIHGLNLRNQNKLKLKS